MTEDLQGKFFGIGIEFNIFSDTLNVLNVLKGGPSYKAGIKTGDKFLAVEDSSITGPEVNTQKIRELLRGTGGTKATITILRKGKQKKIEVTRGYIPLYSMDASYMISDSIGYIRLNKFSETTYKEFMQAVDDLQKKGMKDMILDLRDNGGGILSEAIDIADEFLSGDKLITYTEGAHSPRKEYHCKKDGVFEKGKLVVLANEGTASASEVLMGALQDWDRATILGRRSFGKGLVQEQYVLGDGSGLRLTVARYYTPLGRSIQKSYTGGSDAYNQEVMERYRHGEMEFADSIKYRGDKSYTTSAGKVVYGGGGIMPDIFVPYDTLSIDKEITLALARGTLNNFVYRNYMENEQQFESYSSPKAFDQKYTVDETTLRKLKSYAEKDSISFDLGDEKERSLLQKQIKVMTARQIWRSQGLYEVSNQEDVTVNRAVEFLKNEPVAQLKK
jgi:carboxyl-terminal processing protease